MTEKIMRMLTAEEHSVALWNLAVPSPIFRETDPILEREMNESHSLNQRVKFGSELLVCSLSS